MKTKNNFKWSCAVILIIMGLSVLLSSCVKEENPSVTSSETSPRTVVDNRPAGYGNTPANICNTPGQFAQDENYVYYFSENNKGVPGLYKSGFDFKEKILVSNISGSSLNVLNDCIYYVNEEDNNTIYKMDTDGQNNKKINDFKFVLKVIAVDDKLYFISENEGSAGIYVMDTDGNNINQLTDFSVYLMYIHDNVIYFVGRPESEPYGIYKMNMDGTGQTFLLSAGYYTISDLLIYKDYIYYGEVNYAVMRINVNGGEPEDVTAGIVEGVMIGLEGNINMCNNTLYYSIFHPYEGGIQALNLDTNENRKLTPKRSNNIYIINNQVYFLESQNGKMNYYNMNLDGSNLKKLWETKAVQGGWGLR